MVSRFDLSYAFPVLINSLKTQLPFWDLNLFTTDLISNPHYPYAWINFALFLFLVLVLIFLPFTSVELSLTHRPSVHFRNFSSRLAVSLAASLVLPQPLFWYVYPAILLVVAFGLRTLWLVLVWFRQKLSALPGWSLHITSSLTAHPNAEVELQVPSPEVFIDIPHEDNVDNFDDVGADE